MTVINIYDGCVKPPFAKPKNIILTAADFTPPSVPSGPGTYQNNELKGLIVMVDFNLFSNNGSGTLQNTSSGFTFDSPSGTISALPGNFVIIF